MSASPIKRMHQAAVYLSQQDREALAQGKLTSWQTPPDVMPDHDQKPEPMGGENDRRLIEDIPPHY